MQTLTSTMWEPFGLVGNPFFQRDLRAGDPAYPIDLFVGRKKERERIKRRLGTDSTTRSIVEGDPGVGKTSFVNRLKADLAEDGFVTYDQPVRIDSRSTRSAFIADVLRTLLRMRLGVGLTNDKAIWTRTARMLEGAEVIGGSVSAMGFGAGISRAFVAPQAPPDSLYEHLGAALEEMTAELGRPVVIHVNNLEALSLEDADAASTLILDLRDYLLLEGAHWIFVGSTGIEASVFRRHTQVGGIFPQSLKLMPLPAAELKQLLIRRYEHLALTGHTLTPPIEPDEAARLYALYQGDLRNFLRLLTEAAEVLLGVPGIRPMTELEVRRFAALEYQEKLRDRLGQDDFEQLQRIVAAHGADEVRVADAVKATRLSQPTVSRLFQRLEAKNAIGPTRAVGKNRYYRPAGDVLVAFGADPGPLLS